jgi:hypothetical protein
MLTRCAGCRTSSRTAWRNTRRWLSSDVEPSQSDKPDLEAIEALMRSAIAQSENPIDVDIPQPAQTTVSATEQAAQQYLEFKRQRMAFRLFLAQQH